METLKTINFIIAVIFFVCYTYQFLYIPVPWLRKEKPHGPAKANRYAVLICARNEQRVIGDLIASLRGQTYDQSLLSIFVLADNCTDDTAMVAKNRNFDRNPLRGCNYGLEGGAFSILGGCNHGFRGCITLPMGTAINRRR